jgi:hypothetical protein
MATSQLLRTPYGQRVELIKNAITANSKLGDDAARDLAVHVLAALNSIPEKVR